MSKTIVVEAKGKKIIGQVADNAVVETATDETIDNKIAMGVDEIVAMLGGEMQDPTKKRCSRCVKMGRVPYHPIEDFSLLRNGKRHSQCKVCRVEQSNAWCAKRAEHRKEYHREYHKSRPRRVAIPKGVKAIMDAYAETPAVETNTVNASEALFVAFTDNDELQLTDG